MLYRGFFVRKALNVCGLSESFDQPADRSAFIAKTGFQLSN